MIISPWLQQEYFHKTESGNYQITVFDVTSYFATRDVAIISLIFTCILPSNVHSVEYIHLSRKTFTQRCCLHNPQRSIYMNIHEDWCIKYFH